MQITHLGHSAVLVETDQTRVLIDPGTFSDRWHGLTDLTAVLVTHVHPDHLDPAQVPALLAANPSVQVYAESSVPDALAANDVDLGAMIPVADSDEFKVGDLVISVMGRMHAEIHRDIPWIGNVGYVLRAEGEPSLFHPGDSYATTPDGVDVLAMPVHAPWCAMKETIDFVRAVGALETFPIHEQLLNGRGFDMITGRVEAMTSSRVLDLRSATAHQFG